ncbi:ATP-binding protein [Salibacterium aidingense]|uniref:ATP-binding protein n=1 Tax=Salibacterium aidingense TaxID=384933 RepID=UPI0004209A0A|nr:sensor histidine kinase [Salibacterium aidingense]
MQVSIQTKIIILIFTLLTFVTVVLSGFFAYLESQDIEDTLGDKALSTATYVAGSPVVREAFASENPSSVLQPYAERIREQSGAEFVVIGDENGIRYAHPDEWKIGEHMVGGDNARALENGESYISQAEGTLGPSLRGKTPVRNDAGDIVGIISVGFLIEDLRATVVQRLGILGLLALFAIGIGTVGAVFLSRSIKKDMYGLEPFQIANLYEVRQATLKAIREGIIAIDTKSTITMVNDSAIDMLGFQENVEGSLVTDILPNSVMERVLQHGEPEFNQEFSMNGKLFIVNREPIYHKDTIAGVVSTFRDKTEMMDMANTLSDIKKYSDDLRSQNHEFSNKLYALAGYLHLGKIEEAIQLIEEETVNQERQTSVLFHQIKDSAVQAILTGKAGRASERKIEFNIDEASQLDPLPEHISQTQLISILGNVIDNAMDASLQHPAPSVSFFVTDLGNDIIFEVTDNGNGLPADLPDLMEKGFSTKTGEHKRGYGLAIIRETVEDLGGMIEFHNREEGGTVFSIYIPKNK